MLVKVGTEGKTKDVGLLDVTPENYIVPKGEEYCYHCRIEMVEFSKTTGERLSTPRIQIFGIKAFETLVLHNLRKMGYTVVILHDPKTWEAANKEKIEANKRAKAEATAKAEAEAKAQERERMKAELRAELLAELKASGSVQTESKKGRPKKQEAEAQTEAQTENDENEV